MKKDEGPVFRAPSWEVLVRDYECDLQGIVNNSVYLNYYEHSRSLVLAACELSLAGLAKEGIHLVVSRIDIRYRQPLYPGQVCNIQTSVQARGIMRVVFSHRLFFGDVLCNEAEVTVVSSRQGRPQPITWLAKLFASAFPAIGESVDG